MQKSPLLSEYKAHSDRRRRKNHEAVRIQSSFGQEKEEKARTCQNTKLIRTGEGGKSPNLSEYKAHSDRRGRKKPDSVRKQGLFVQKKKIGKITLSSNKIILAKKIINLFIISISCISIRGVVFL